MSENKAQNGQTGRHARLRRYLVPAVIAVLIAAMLLGLLWVADLLQPDEDIDALLAEIEAARALPDEENAATAYRKLFERAVSMPLDSIGTQEADLTRTRPWKTADHPEVAEWIAAQNDVLEELLQVTRMDELRIPIPMRPGQNARDDYRRGLHKLAALLVHAGNNDLGEGRSDEGIDKHLCLIRMARHLYQQPFFSERQKGFWYERIALGLIGRFVMEDNPTQEQLKKIEADLSGLQDKWIAESADMVEVETLLERKYSDGVSQLLSRIAGKSTRDFMDSTKRLYVNTIALRRGTRILIELRRHRDRTGRWPQTLAEIADSLPAEALVDPLSAGDFVYRLTDDGFTLYSKGLNATDEDGTTYVNNADDLLIWDSSAPPPVSPIQ